MSAQKSINSPNNKIFFIFCNESEYEKKYKFSLQTKGVTNLNKILINKQFCPKGFNTYVLFFEIIPDKLKDIYYDKEKDKYKTVILIKVKEHDHKYDAEIYFQKEKNIFIYD